MLENIAMWGGIAGCVLALVAILVIIFVKAEIKQLLNKDKILFDHNFTLKKQAIEDALNVVDELDENPAIIQTPAFKEKAKRCYNNLLCVCSDVRLAEAFYHITTSGANSVLIAHFKVSCRKDIGLKVKNAQLVKRVTAQANAQPQQQFNTMSSYQEPVQPMQPIQPQVPVQPVQPMQQPRPVQPAQPIQQPRPVQPGVRPMQRPMQQRPVAPAQQSPIRPTQNPIRKTDHD